MLSHRVRIDKYFAKTPHQIIAIRRLGGVVLMSDLDAVTAAAAAKDAESPRKAIKKSKRIKTVSLFVSPR